MITILNMNTVYKIFKQKLVGDELAVHKSHSANVNSVK